MISNKLVNVLISPYKTADCGDVEKKKILFIFSAFVCLCTQPSEDTLQVLVLSSQSQISNLGHQTSQESPSLTESPGWPGSRVWPLLLI